MKALIKIQQELKAPKNRHNSFGDYNYRSCEDILEAVKPLLVKHGALLTLKDDVVEVGGRVYVKATATFIDAEGTIEVTAFAREAMEKKKMDDSQITGTASSYARKYALNGLFLIDDTKDADTDEYTIRTTGQIGTEKANALEIMLSACGQDPAKFAKFYKVKSLAEITEEQRLQIIAGVRARDGHAGKA